LDWKQWLAGRRPSGKGRRQARLFVEMLEDRLTPSTLIPVTNHRDLVFDSSRNLLYITTSAGTVQRYDVINQALLSPLSVGTTLNGADLSADSSTLYVAESQTNSSTGQGVVHKVDLASGTVSNVGYGLDYLEGGSWGVSVPATGKPLLDTMFNGSGWVYVRQYDPATGNVTKRTDKGLITQNTLIHRSADRNLLFFTESNNSAGPIFTYNATTDSFSGEFDTNFFLDSKLSAVNRNGSLIALENFNGGVTVMNPSFQTVTTLSGLAGGVTFDPVRDLLYAVNTSTSQVVAYNTNTWAVSFQVPVGETATAASAFGNGVMTVSNDGSLLFLSTTSGVRMINLPSPSGTQVIVSGFPNPATAGTPGSFTVIVEDAQGNPLTGYTGTVHFASSDGQAVLPANYTFTAADAGTHTFSATLKTVGLQSISVIDTASPISGTQGNITVTPAAASQFTSNFPGLVTAGTSTSFTLTAKDPYGNVVTSYTGTVHFTSTDPQAGLPADYTFVAGDHGVHSFSATLKTAGTQSLTATDTSNANVTGTQSTQVAAAGVSTLTVSGYPSPTTADVVHQVTVQARDAYGNLATSFLDKVHFTSTDPRAVLPSDYQFTSADGGTHTFNATFRTAGTQSLKAQDITVPFALSGTQSGIQVNPGPVNALPVALPQSVVAGTPFTFTVSAIDTAGNVVPTYTGTVYFTSSDPQAALPASYTFTAADAGSHTFTTTLFTAGPQTVVAHDVITPVPEGGVASSTLVTPGAASQFVLASPVAVAQGSPFSMTLTVYDAYGNVATNYSGKVHFTSSDPAATLPADFTFSANAGGHWTFNGVVLQTLGSQTVTATDTANASLSGSATPTVNPEPAGLHFQVTTGVSTVTAGTGFDMTVTALDGWGNVASGYTGTVHFTTSDNSGQAILPADYTFAPSDLGLHVFHNVVLVRAGTQSITAADPGITDGSSVGSASVLVTPGPFRYLGGSAYPSPITAGTAGSFTITAYDTYGNIATGYTGTVKFVSNDSQAVLPANYTFTADDAGAHTFSATFKTAGTRTMTVSDTVTGSSVYYTNITVTPAAASSLFVRFYSSDTTTAGNTTYIDVWALDPYGNVATGYTGTVHLTSTDPQASLPADFTFTGQNAGFAVFPVVLKTAGTQYVTVTDTVNSSLTGTTFLHVLPAAAKSIVAYVPPAGSTLSTTAGQVFTLAVKALDAYGNIATSFTGMVTWTSSDPLRTLPAAYTFVPGDQGVHTFTNGFVLRTAGTQTVTASWGTTSSSTVTDTVSAAAASSFSLAAPSTSTAGTAFSLTVTARDPYGNVAPSFAGTVHFTSSDNQATLPADYTFTTADAGIHTFTNGVTLRSAGSRSITATSSQISGTAFVSVTPAAASHVGVTVPASVTAGTAFTTTVTALDDYNNTATAYRGTVAFTSSDGQAVLPGNYTFTGTDAGSHTFTNGVTLKTAGSQSVTTTDTTTASITGTGSVPVNPAAAASLLLSAPASTTAGAAFSVTATAVDSYGNTATGFTGTVHFTSTDGAATLPADYTFAASDAGTHIFSGVTLVTAGSQSLSVTASGVSTGSATVSVSPAAATSLTLAAPATATAGAAFSVTLTARDAYGNVATGYTGTVHFTSSDGQATVPGDYTFTASDGGTHTFSGVLLDTAGTQTVTASDSAATLSSSASVNVGAATATHLRAAAPASSTAGAAFDMTLTALDAFNNVATGYTGTVSFASSDTTAGLPGNYTFTTSDAGSHTFSGGVTLYHAGTQAVSATDTQTSSITGSATVQVGAAAAASFAVTGPAAAAAGTAFDATVTARDAYGNVVTGYTGTVHFTSSDAQASLPGNYTFTASDAGMHTFSGGVTLDTAGEQTVTATDTATSSLTGGLSVTVSPAAATHLAVSGPLSATAGTAFTLQVTSLDTFGNVATGYTGTVHFTSSDGNATLPADYTFTATDGGVHTFTATLKTAGTQSLSAADTATGSLSGTQSGISVVAGVATTFTVAGFPSPTTAGTAHSVTVTALDAYGNVATGYRGTVHFTSSDAQAALPADYTFTTADSGLHTFSATLKTAGSQSLTATDTTTGTVTGSQTGIGVTAAAVSAFRITGFPAPVTAGVAGTFTVHAVDAYGNLVTGYTGTVVFSSSDAQAVLPGSYTFTAADGGSHTFSATLRTAGAQSITVRDAANSGVLGTQSGILVNPGAATHFRVTAPATVTAGTAFSVTVTALDAWGNVATGYRGRAHFTSTDHRGILPSDYTFLAADAGVHVFSVTLRSTGTQTITVRDTVTGAIVGSVTVNVIR
jgi:hypothetical protein